MLAYILALLASLSPVRSLDIDFAHCAFSDEPPCASTLTHCWVRMCVHMRYICLLICVWQNCDTLTQSNPKCILSKLYEEAVDSDKTLLQYSSVSINGCSAHDYILTTRRYSNIHQFQ